MILHNSEYFSNQCSVLHRICQLRCLMNEDTQSLFDISMDDLFSQSIDSNKHVFKKLNFPLETHFTSTGTVDDFLNVF